MKKFTVSKCKLKFLLKCRNYDIFPRHISKLSKAINNISFHSNLIKKKASHTTECIKKELQNLEIRDINIYIKFLNNSINSQLTKLKASISETITDEFLKYYENTLTYFQCKHTTRYTKKFNGLLQQYNIKDPQTSLHTNTNTTNNNNDSDIKKTKEKWLIHLTNVQIPPL